MTDKLMHMESSATFEGKSTFLTNCYMVDESVRILKVQLVSSLKTLNLLQPVNTPLHTSEFLNR